MIESLEWLRPEWLFALPAGLALLWAWWRASAGAGLWRRLVDPELLSHLVGGARITSAHSARITSAHSALGIAATVLVLASVALAGPTWRDKPVPLYRDQTARIVVLDLSPSMDAVDVIPSRIERARQAIVTILRESPGAQLGVVVFGADAFAVAPLMNDAAALVHLVGSLGTATLPRAGSRPDLGLELAHALLTRAGAVAGDVVLVGDSAGDARTLEAARALAQAGFPLSVLAVGTPHGGPVRRASGAFARSEADEVLVVKPDLAALERVARAGGGRFHLLAAHDASAADSVAPRFARRAQDWAAVPRVSEAATHGSKLRQDDGIWFVLLALPFAALLFRRGWLAGLAALALTIGMPPPPAHAFDWSDLWRRSDQQAAAEFASGRIGDNAKLLSKVGAESLWHAVLLYRSARFAEAAAKFAEQDTAEAHYNRGNALALEGRFEQAIAAYGAALERRPAMRDALFNRALVREALAKRRARTGARAAQRADPRAPSARPPRTGPSGRGTQPRPGRAEAEREARSGAGAGSGRAEARTDLAQSQADIEDDTRRPDEALDGPELQRLERLLAQVPDDPGSLLANRFAWQLRRRGNWHHDTGGRW